MKKLILLLFIPLVFACSSDTVKKPEDKKNDLDELNLNGKVKSLRETTYSALDKFGEPVKDELMDKYEYIFNEDGFYTELNSYNKDGEFILLKRKYKYDKESNLIELNNYNNNNGKLIQSEKYKYDDGNMIEENIYRDGKLLNKSLLKYDDDGKMIEENSYSDDLEIDWKGMWKYQYDDDGNEVEAIWYATDGNIQFNWKFKYDDNGNKVEENMYEKNGELYLNKNFKYDDDGNMIETSNYDEEGELIYMFKYKYENFDNNKNWLKRIWYDDGKATVIFEREIEYYD